MNIHGFEWDDGNILHLALHHGIEPTEAEETFVFRPLFRRTKRGHYAVFGPTRAGRLLVVVFKLKPRGVARVITGWDMDAGERQYYQKRGKGRGSEG